MVPPGWETAAKLVNGMFPKISETEWNLLVDSTPSDQSDSAFKECIRLVKEGCVAVNPMLLLRNRDESFRLSGVNCAYVKASSSVDETVRTVERLLESGVRSFSIYVCSQSSAISTLFEKLAEKASKAPPQGPKPIFAVWAELHCKRLLEYIAEVSEIDAMHFTGKQQNKKDGDSLSVHCSTTVGVLVPKLFFELISQREMWLFHEAVASIQLGSSHGAAYSKKYVQLRSKSEGALAVPAEKVLSMLVRACVSNSTKHVLLLRDSCHSLKATAEGASVVWNDTVLDAPIFPNHMAEVPLVCSTDITLQFAAFINAERAHVLRVSNAECCSAAYLFLQVILNNHILAAQLQAQVGEVLSMSSAVGLIGVHDALALTDDGEDEQSHTVCRPVSASDIERIVVPLIRTGHAVFPMSGTLPSILWRVSPGSWTSQQPYWLYTSTSGERVVVPSGAFARFCHETAVSLDHIDSLNAAAEKYSDRFSRMIHGRILSTRIEAQIHHMRKLCSSFFSTTSMPLTLPHEAAREFQSSSALLMFLVKAVIKNANNDCPVLLPEVRTSDTDVNLASLRRKLNLGQGPIRRLWSTCIKRRKSNETISAVEELGRFFEEVVAMLHDFNDSAQKPLSQYALQVFEKLTSHKIEEM